MRSSFDFSSFTSVGENSAELAAVVLHRGSYGHGHYIAFSRNARDGQWYETNDDYVMSLPSENVGHKVRVVNDAVLCAR